MDRTHHGDAPGADSRAQKVSPDRTNSTTGATSNHVQQRDFTGSTFFFIIRLLCRAAFFVAGWQAAAAVFGGGAA